MVIQLKSIALTGCILASEINLADKYLVEYTADISTASMARI